MKTMQGAFSLACLKSVHAQGVRYFLQALNIDNDLAAFVLGDCALVLIDALGQLCQGQTLEPAEKGYPCADLLCIGHDRYPLLMKVA